MSEEGSFDKGVAAVLGAFGGWTGAENVDLSHANADEIQKKLGVTNLCNAPRSPTFAFDAAGGPGGAFDRQQQRGFITVADSSDSARWKMRCLFNPPEVGYTFRVGAERFDTDREAGDGAFLVDGASVSFEMYLDRSRELAMRPARNYDQKLSRRAPNNGFAIWSPQNIGVLHDLAVFNLVVVGDASFGAGGTSPGYIPKTKKVKLNLSPGTIRSDQRLEFEGFITSTNVSFTMFTQDMVPMMGAMSITLQRTYDDTGSTTSGGVGQKGDDDLDTPYRPPGGSDASPATAPHPLTQAPINQPRNKPAFGSDTHGFFERLYGDE